MSAEPAAGACRLLRRIIAPDLQALMRCQCARCRWGVGPCLVLVALARLREARGGRPLPH